jgi:hypothetical protein
VFADVGASVNPVAVPAAVAIFRVASSADFVRRVRIIAVVAPVISNIALSTAFALNDVLIFPATAAAVSPFVVVVEMARGEPVSPAAVMVVMIVPPSVTPEATVAVSTCLVPTPDSDSRKLPCAAYANSLSDTMDGET